ncbi:MAG: hypothetical protein BWY09_01023 [Candidatus Hydrogenedentes bacterium ADurb.Bin179]|nr:MAG: hypothetical protein BWY09_01023 [Candidatus Hydrogenedentes bacterium ADurb.Bin179]
MSRNTKKWKWLAGIQVKPVFTPIIARNDIEAAVAVYIAQGDTKRVEYVVRDVHARQEGAATIIQEQLVFPAHVSDNNIGKTVPVDVPNLDGSRCADIRTDVKPSQGTIAVVDVTPVSLLHVADNNIKKPVFVDIPRRNRGGGLFFRYQRSAFGKNTLSLV